MGESINRRIVVCPNKTGEILIKKGQPKGVGYILHGVKKTKVAKRANDNLQLRVGDVNASPVRIYTTAQIEVLRQYNRNSVGLSKKNKQKLAWLKFKNVLLGITEKELLSIEKREWNMMPR